MKHSVICVTISHNNRFNFKHVSRYFFTYCRVNPYFPEKLNDVTTIQPFVQIFYFSINSTKNILIDKMDVLFQKSFLFVFFRLNLWAVNGLTGLCFSCNKDPGSFNTNTLRLSAEVWRGRQVATIMEYLTTFPSSVWAEFRKDYYWGFHYIVRLHIGYLWLMFQVKKYVLSLGWCSDCCIIQCSLDISS